MDEIDFAMGECLDIAAIGQLLGAIEPDVDLDLKAVRNAGHMIERKISRLQRIFRSLGSEMRT